jgi:hypothetical protein
MGSEQIAALIAILQAQQRLGTDSLALGTWTIRFDKRLGAFTFDKCEAEGYCEERPAVIALAGDVLDRGGPLFG